MKMWTRDPDISSLLFLFRCLATPSIGVAMHNDAGKMSRKKQKNLFLECKGPKSVKREYF